MALVAKDAVAGEVAQVVTTINEQLLASGLSLIAALLGLAAVLIREYTHNRERKKDDLES